MVTTSLAVVIPVLNEEVDLPRSTERVVKFLQTNLDNFDWRLVIVDNGSTDSTAEVGKALSNIHDRVQYIRLEQRGRGLALRTAWTNSFTDLVAYMDVDLSSDLNTFARLVQEVNEGGFDLAIASRLMRESQVMGRPLVREVISRIYSIIVRVMFLTPIRDYQCGCKVLSRTTTDDLVPLVEDNGWFFDSELILIASANGYKIKELPVKWTDDIDSRVRIIKTAYGDFKGLLRLRFGGLNRAATRLRQRDY